MGRTYTPAYAIEVRTDDDNGYWTPAGWDSKNAGRPTPTNLAKYVAVMEASTRPGGCNAHLGATTILRAAIYTNRGEKRLVAEYRAPAFRVLEAPW